MINWIKEMQSTERGKIVLKFSLYLLFFFFVIILCVVAGAMGGFDSTSKGGVESGESVIKEESKREESTDAKDSLTYFEKQKLLYEGKYEFAYKIKTENEEISFLGENDRGKESGFRETEGELIYYVVEEGTAYKINVAEKEKIEDLYLGHDKDMFDFELLFSRLNSTTAIIERVDDKKIYSYVRAGKNFRVTTNEFSIERIEINFDNTLYDLQFEF